MTVFEQAFAKINLFLDVTNKRADGYHDIRSIMQTVSLRDTIEIEALEPEANEKRIALTCSEPSLPCDEKNLAHKAASAFFQEAGTPSYSCTVHIDKVIPMEAGLAGGSSDAAAVLRGLNRLYGEPFDTDRLCTIGARLGADVPFCILEGTCLCEGIGEILTPLSPMPDCYIVIARGGEGVSTPAAYRLVDERWNNDFTVSGGNMDSLCAALDRGDINGIAGSMYNIFEDVILPSHSVASKLKEIMSRHGAVGAMMSGSGPSVFGIFTTKDAALAAATEAAKVSRAFVCKPVRDIEI